MRLGSGLVCNFKVCSAGIGKIRAYIGDQKAYIGDQKAYIGDRGLGVFSKLPCTS